MTPPGPTQLLIILLVVVLLFGAKKLPDLARSVGRSSRILKTELNAGDDKTGDATPPRELPEAGAGREPQRTEPSRDTRP
ncbi:twin-arginine translocase TatA/TatE family subunit [Pseudonocardia sp. NPDC049635]|uniref:twin-arginine translocase TatA/TatE family subunit n=1 Tax=Pseudonocardia sp. NPDC049635 TaxID=3155506 RepID=UPI0033E9D47C